MNLFYQSAFLKALGWSLVDSLWQMGLLWLLYILFTANGRKFSSATRYTLGLMAVASGCVWFAVSVGVNYYNIKNGNDPGIGFASFTWMPLVSSFYLLAVLFFAARWIFQFKENKNIYNEKLSVANSHYEQLISELGVITGLRRKVVLWMSEKISTPVTFGFLKPVILLPVAALNQLTTRQVEAVLIHEFYHIKRNDYLINILMTGAEVILFFNPFARLLMGDIRKERENCCDDEVIALGYDRWEYAEALYILGKTSAPAYGFALAATGKGKQLLLQRVKRMLDKGCSSPSLVKPLSTFFLCLIIAGSISRDLKQAPSPATLPIKETTPAILARQDIVIKTSTPVPNKIQVQRKEKRAIMTGDTPEVPAPPSPPIAMPVVAAHENYENMILISYATNNQETIEFCLIEAPVSPSRTSTGTVDDSHPFIPGSTFYYPGHELSGVENGKTTVDL